MVDESVIMCVVDPVIVLFFNWLQFGFVALERERVVMVQQVGIRFILKLSNSQRVCLDFLLLGLSCR